MKKNHKSPGYIYFFISMMVYITPIILANFYYVDDNYRAITGDDAWDIDGRPLSNVIMYALNLHTHLSDIFPLPSIIAAAILAFCSYKYSQKLTSCDDIFITKLLLPLGVMVSPFLVENSSYRFDILPMYCSIALSYVFVIVKLEHQIIRITIFSACVAAILSTYQAAINFTLSLILCELIRICSNGESSSKIIKKITENIISIALGAILYFKAILPMFLTSPTTTDHPGIDLGKIKDVFIDNSIYYMSGIYNSAPSGMVAAFAVIIFVASIISGIIIAIERLKIDRSISSLLVSALIIIAPIVSVLFSFISLSFLDNKIYAPRVLIGFSGTCLFMYTMVYYLSKRTTKYIMLLLCVPLIYSAGLYSAYSNAMSTDKQFTEMLFSDIKRDSFMLSKNESPMLYFNGQRPMNKVFSNSFKNYPIITRIVPNYFYNWTLPYTYMSRLGMKIRQPSGVNPIELISSNGFCSSEMLKSYDYNMIYKDGLVIVDFSKELCK